MYVEHMSCDRKVIERPTHMVNEVEAKEEMRRLLVGTDILGGKLSVVRL